MIKPNAPAFEVVAALDLAPHPEGGWFRRMWTAKTPLTTEELTAGQPAHSSRGAASAILYLLESGHGSAWHRLHSSEELWLWRAGAPLLLHTGGFGAAPAPEQVARVDGSATGLPGQLIAKKQWQRATVATPGWSLVTCVVCPEFEFTDFELAGTDRVGNRNPAH